LAHDPAAWAACLAVAIDAAADLDGQDAQVGHQFAGRREAVDVEDEGGEDGGGDSPMPGMQTPAFMAVAEVKVN
jgi:hypothetical protein